MMPQIIYVILTILGMGIVIAKHGSPKEGNYNFLHSLIVTAIQISILYWGGFFDKI